MWLKEHKSFLMPLAMLLGILTCNIFSKATFLIPICLFLMLFLAYCALDFRRLRIRKVNLIMIAIHLLLIVGLYFIAALLFDKVIAISVLICVLCPASASSSAVVFALGGNKETCITHILLDNIFVTIFAPIVLSYVVPTADTHVFASMLKIFNHIMPILILPLIIVIFIKRLRPKIADKIAQYQWTSLIFWSLCLMVIFAQATFMIIHCTSEQRKQVLIMALVSLILCIVQFVLGKYIGKKLKKPIAVGQGLAQKNTSLGIWLVNAYVQNPLSIIIPTAYSLWQNIFNSWQMYRHEQKEKKGE